MANLKFTDLASGAPATADDVVAAARSGVSYQLTLSNILQLATGSASGTVAGTGSAGQVSFWESASVQTGSFNFYWDDSSGSLGIGTTTPNLLGSAVTALTISDDTFALLEFQDTSNITTGDIGFIDFYNGTDRVVEIGGHPDGATDAGALSVWTQPTGGSLTQRMRITSDGNVGIGTSAPLDTLSVTGSTLASGRRALGISATLNSTAATQVGANFDLTSAGSHGSANIAFSVSLLAGYTGTGLGGAFSANTFTQGTGVTPAANGVANIGAGMGATGATAGANIGAITTTTNSTFLNAGFFGKASFDNASATNIGAVGMANNDGGGAQMGGYFFLYTDTNTDPTYASLPSAALVADNQSTTDPIFLALDNEVTVFQIIDGGGVIQASGGGTWEGAHTFNEAGADVDFRVEGNTEPNLLAIDAGTNTVNVLEVNSNVSHPLQLANENTNVALGVTVASNTQTHHALISLEHYRGTLSSPTANSADDWLGKVRFVGYTNQRGAAAEISGYADTGWGATGADTPGYLVFGTSPNGSSTPEERMRIDSVGNVGIGTISPTAKTQISGAAGDVELLRAENDTGTVFSVTGSDNAGAGFVVLPITGGAPTEAKPDGAMIVDSTNNFIYVRVGGAWLSASLA